MSLLATGTASAGGAFSIPITVADNTTTQIRAKAMDATGNTSACSLSSISYEEFSVDPSEPVFTTSTPVSPANDNSPIISGTSDANVTVTLYSDSLCTTTVASGVSNSSGNFNIAVTRLDNTTTTFYARADVGGSYSGCSTSTLTYVEDSLGPAAPTISSSTPTSPSTNQTPTIIGTTIANTTVNLYSNSTCTTLIATGTSDGAGQFSISTPVSANILTTIYATALDQIGNPSNCSSVAFNYEARTSLPTPTIASVSPAGPANNNSPTVTGSAHPNSTVNVYSNSLCTTLVGTGSANGSGNFSIPASVSDNSTSTFYAQAVYAATSACSLASANYTEDSLAPSVPTLGALSPAGPSNINTPVLTGTGEALAGIKAFSNSTCTTEIGSGSINGSGNYSLTLTVPENTTSTIYARSLDAAGNASACSTTFLSYTENSVVPTVPVFTASSVASPSNQNTTTISGTTIANINVEIFRDASCTTSLATGTSNGTGLFAIAISVLDNSTNTIYAKASDLSGNASACSGLLYTYIEDSTPPTLPTLTGFDVVSPTNYNTPSVLGTSDPGVTIKLYSDTNCLIEIASGTANGSGSFTVPVTVTDNSTTNIYSNSRDLAGNFSACTSSALVYVEDSNAPAMPILTGSSPSLKSSLQAATISGTAEANTEIELYSDATCSTLVTNGTASGGGAFNLAITAPLNIARNYYATATDAGGNTSSCSTTFASYEAYTIPTGVGHFSGNLTTAPTTNTNLNQTTAYSIRWSTGEFDYNNYEHSTTINSHQVKVTQAGDYQLSLNIPISGAVGNGSIHARVRVNGVNQSAGQTFTFTSNASGHTQSNAALNMLLSGLAVNSLIDVTVIRTGNTGTISISGSARLYLEKVASSRVIFTGTATQSTNSTNLNQATAYPLSWTQGTVRTGFVHSNSTSPQSVTLSAVGDYIVHLNIPVTGAVANGSVKSVVKINGTPIPGAEGKQGYITNANGMTESSLHWSGLVRTASANSILTVDVQAEAAAGTISVIAGAQASLFVERLDSTSNLFSAAATSLVSGTNINSTAASPFQFTSAPLKDASIFTHSTSTNSHNIQVTTAGDYLLYFGGTYGGTSAQVNAALNVAVNGTAVSGAQMTSSYVRATAGHNESSTMGVFLLRRLNANATITITSIREAATGTLTSPSSLVTIIRKP